MSLIRMKNIVFNMKIGNIILLLACMVFFSGCRRYGEEVTYNNLQIFYKDGASREEASRLGDYLIRAGFSNEKEHEVTIQLTRTSDRYQFRMVGKKGAIDDPDNVKLFHKLATELSREVFDNTVVEVHICDDRLKTLQIYQMETIADWEKYTGTNYEIRYPYTWEVSKGETVGTEFTISPIPSTNAGKKIFVSLASEDLSADPMTIEQYTQYSLEIIRNSSDYYKDFKVLESNYHNSDNGEQARLVYTVRLGETDLKFIQVFTIKDDRSYILSIMMAIDEDRAQMIKTAEDIISTFALTQ